MKGIAGDEAKAIPDKTDDEATAIQDKKEIPKAVDEAIEEDSEDTRPLKKIRETADKTKAIQDKNGILKSAEDETKAITKTMAKSRRPLATIALRAP